jgi:hypothetical protein
MKADCVVLVNLIVLVVEIHAGLALSNPITAPAFLWSPHLHHHHHQ